MEALCFVAGRASEMEAAGPRLWAGLGNGKVVVFDATTWDEIGKTRRGSAARLQTGKELSVR